MSKLLSNKAIKFYKKTKCGWLSYSGIVLSITPLLFIFVLFHTSNKLGNFLIYRPVTQERRSKPVKVTVELAQRNIFITWS